MKKRGKIDYFEKNLGFFLRKNTLFRKKKCKNRKKIRKILEKTSFFSKKVSKLHFLDEK